MPVEVECIKRAADSLAAALRFRTVLTGGQTEWTEWVKLRDWLRRRYPNIHSTLTREVVGDYSLLFRWAADSPLGDPLLLCGHLDVAAAEGLWEYPPFSGEARDGYIWGRGALGGKNVVVCLMETIENMIVKGFRPTRDIWIAFGHDHEGGGAGGAGAIARLFAERELKFAMVLDGGGCLSRRELPLKNPAAWIGVAEKGRVMFKLTAAFRGGHASDPDGRTAADLLAEAIARIGYRKTKTRWTAVTKAESRALRPLLPMKLRSSLKGLPAGATRTTFAVTGMSAGSDSGSAVLPHYAEAYVDARLLPGDTAELTARFLKELLSDLNVTVETVSGDEPSPVSDYKSAEFQGLSACIRSVFGATVCVPSLLPAQSDARRYGQYCDKVFRFAPFSLTVKDLGCLYAADEGARADSFGSALGFYHELLTQMCG
ncbi:peptidase M20 [Clostridia bacterium]|nr:peptidase M20 [Clostridia bacterium]